MDKKTKILVVLVLVGLFVIVILSRGVNDGSSCCPFSPSAGTSPAGSAQPVAAPQPMGSLPRLVELGSTSCMPCQRMKPILEQLQKDYAGRLVVEMIDVNRDRDLARPYGVRLIPTQVFLSAEGKELSRHVGYISRENILRRWKEHGVTFTR
jgi:thioredoxin 1